PRQFVVATASVGLGGWPSVHFAEQVHQRQGALDGRGSIRSGLAALCALPLLGVLPSRHHAPNSFRVHGTEYIGTEDSGSTGPRTPGNLLPTPGEQGSFTSS